MMVFLSVYVDDIAITGNDTAAIETVCNQLKKKFKMTDIRQLFIFLKNLKSKLKVDSGDSSRSQEPPSHAVAGRIHPRAIEPIWPGGVQPRKHA
jgi:hypothetical protein